MSYDISTWKTKKIKNLQIPMKAFQCENKEWRPDIEYIDDNKCSLSWGSKDDIIGHIENKILHVHSIDISGEGSGGTLYYCLDDAIQHSKGELLAVRIWEGGDSINQIHVKDGVITEDDIEL